MTSEFKHVEQKKLISAIDNVEESEAFHEKLSHIKNAAELLNKSLQIVYCAEHSTENIGIEYGLNMVLKHITYLNDVVSKIIDNLEEDND